MLKIDSTIFHLKEKKLIEIEAWMRPGKASAAGFLGINESLKDVVEKDLRYLKERQISCPQIALRLKEMIGEADRLFKRTPFSNKFEVEVKGKKFIVTGVACASNGTQECPFHPWFDCGNESRRDLAIENPRNFQVVRFSELQVHLIGVHAFFQGDTSYRTDPQLLCDVLELEKEEPSFKEYTEEKKLKLVHQSYLLEDAVSRYETSLQGDAKESIALDGGATAYLLPYSNVLQPNVSTKMYWIVVNRVERLNPIQFEIGDVQLGMEIQHAGLFSFLPVSNLARQE